MYQHMWKERRIRFLFHRHCTKEGFWMFFMLVVMNPKWIFDLLCLIIIWKQEYNQYISTVKIFSNISLGADSCQPYTKTTCRKVAMLLGMKLGTESTNFADFHPTKGCHTFKTGSYKGSVLYGLGGNDEEISEVFGRDAAYYRPEGFDCIFGNKKWLLLIEPKPYKSSKLWSKINIICICGLIRHRNRERSPIVHWILQRWTKFPADRNRLCIPMCLWNWNMGLKLVLYQLW